MIRHHPMRRRIGTHLTCSSRATSVAMCHDTRTKLCLTLIQGSSQPGTGDARCCAMHGRSTARVCTVCRCTSRQPCCTHDLLQHCSLWVARPALCGQPKARKSCATGASSYLAAHPRRPKAARGEAGSSAAIGPRCGYARGSTRPAHGAGADVRRHVEPHRYARGADGGADISTATHFGRARGS